MQTLSTPDVDARVTEGLPWVAARYRAAIDWSWLTRQAKLNNFQNRLGFLLELTLPLIENHAPVNAAPYHAIEQARSDLDKARLLREATFCWDSMPEGMRRWTRANRSPSAEYWNVITRLGSERLRHEQQPPSRAPWDSFLSHLEGRVEWKRLPMSQVTFSVPDEMLLALKATPDALAARIRFAASVKLYEMGDLSSGAAAQLAGVPRPYFLSHLADYGVAAFNLTEEELTHDLKSA
jgi:predicted HTH domain antitoxin